MAEAIAVIGLVSSIVQLVDFGTKLIDRLSEFASATDDVPVSFRSIRSQLPLAIITLQRVEEQARSGRVRDADAQVLKPVVDNSLDEIKRLTEFLDSAVPAGSFSTLQTRWQGLKSLRYDKKVSKCAERLQANVQVLIFHQTTNHSDIVEHIRESLSRLNLLPLFQPLNLSFGLNLSNAPEVAEGTFIGRHAEVIQLDQWLSPQSSVPRRQRVAAIVGLGGLGKTQLGIMFAKEHHEKYSSVFWLNVKDELSLKQDFVRLSQVIRIEQGSGSTGLADEDLIVQQVLRWFSQPENDRWLLIFDNYDDPRLPGVKSTTGYDIRRYFPTRSQGSILITTRSHRLTFARQLKLTKLEDLNESIEVLSSRSGRDLSSDPAAAKLAQRLDGLPLALATAGSYLGQSAESVNEYLHAYEDYWHELDDTAEELVEYEDRTLFSTWNLSLAHVQAQFPEIAKLLRLFAYFDNQDISYELLKPGKDLGFEWLSSLTANQRQFNRAMGRLHDYSLVEVTGDHYYLHPCVHDWTLQALNRCIHPSYFWLAVHCVASNVKTDSERDYWQNNQRFLPHAVRLEQKRLCGALEEEPTGHRLEDLRSLASLWIQQGQFSEAEKMFQKVLAHQERIFGPTHILTLDAVHDFGALRTHQGNIIEAEKLYQRVLMGRERDLGFDHASTLNTVHNLGVVYRAQGDLTKAEKLYQRALAGKENIFGPDHALTLDTIYNIGNLHKDQKKMVEAEQMYQRALAGYKKTLGANHTSTLDTVYSLGLLYYDQKKMVEAEQMYQRALAGREKTLGPNHTLTLNTTHSLGLLYYDQKKMVEAEQMYQRTLAGREKTPGPNHSSTLNTVHNLGVLYYDQNKIVEAEQMYQRALVGYEKTLGPDHTSTFNTVYSLGVLYYDQKKMIEAEQMYQRALAGYEKTFGPNHTSTLDTVHNLGLLYYDQKKMVEAEQMYQRALAGREKTLGPNHTLTLNTVHNLGLLYYYQKKIIEAEQMYQRALAGREKTPGPDHSLTLDTVHNLGVLYYDQNKIIEAEQMYQRALVGYEKTLGPDHTLTLNTVHNLGLLYYNQKKIIEAEQMYQRALAGREKTLGPDHSSTLSTVHNLGLSYYNQKKMIEAEQMYQRVLAGYKKTLGPDHTSTLNTVHSLGLLYYDQGRLSEGIKLAYHWRAQPTRLCNILGRMLIRHSDELNAKIAFRHLIGYEKGVMVHKNIKCDGCGLLITCAMRRFVCKDCQDGDLCGECFEKHEAGGREVQTCSRHSFLEIAFQTSSGSESGSLTVERSRTSWLEHLMRKYAEQAA